MNIAALATWAPGCGSRHGREWRPNPTPTFISSCQAGWNSTSSIRWPNRSWVRSFGGFSFASRPQRWASALPANAPTSPMASAAQSAPSRRTASVSARSAVKTL